MSENIRPSRSGPILAVVVCVLAAPGASFPILGGIALALEKVSLRAAANVGVLATVGGLMSPPFTAIAILVTLIGIWRVPATYALMMIVACLLAAWGGVWIWGRMGIFSKF
jgi:hypothetical protein